MTRNFTVPLVAALVAVGIGVAALVMSSRDGGTAVAQTTPDARGISVSGSGEVLIRPDTAIVSVGVSAQAGSVEEARASAADAMNKVVASVKANGVADADIQTTSFSIQPVYDYSGTTPKLTGYQVSNSVNVTVRGIDATGGNTAKVIDDAAKAAGDLATVNGVNFTIADPNSAVAQAREKAMADAKAKADQLAQLGGVTLGAPIFIQDGGTSQPPIVYATRESAAPAADSSTPIQPGQLSVTSQVQVTYAIQ